MSAPADAATSRWRQPRRGLLAATGFIAVLALVLGIWFGRALMSRVSPEPPAIAGLLIEPPIAFFIRNGSSPAAMIGKRPG